MASRPVAVTGIGLVTSLGKGAEANWQALSAGKSGIHRITRFPTDKLRTTIGGSVDFLLEEPFSATQLSFALAKTAAGEAVAQSGIGTPGDFPGELFLASPPVEHEWPQRVRLDRQAPGQPHTYGGMMAAAAQAGEDLYVDFINGTIADRLADEFGTKGSPITLTTACASGATAIQLGVEAIRRGQTKAALAIGTDGSIHMEALIRFTLLSALSTNNEDPTKAARPFAKGRDGFVMAEGAGALVLEDAEAAKARGATILGYIRGVGEAADTFHRTRSNPNGEAIIRAISDALDDAGVAPGDIDYINAHGTSTPENDKMEAFGIQAVFGDDAANVPVSSNKSMIGHTLTAAGAVEAAISILTLQHQVLPPTINHEGPADIPLDFVPNEARPAEVDLILSNSFGFGGQNVCLVIGRNPD
ncbi:beta-ketoacyl-ACP synthase [Zavarzinia compransoris]|uniref:beta-ketoacyl-ACP synthase n=1 Tax=Zavarzinia marina TaxID=2911065 RepID=UPI001F2D1325|nr:beta-ketoacyl-ACP synthase [Zavarzinia marina]MCF4165522.1 beta-ketoacyl-ACP synthase [Zavarzinia marina]